MLNKYELTEWMTWLVLEGEFVGIPGRGDSVCQGRGSGNGTEPAGVGGVGGGPLLKIS